MASQSCIVVFFRSQIALPSSQLTVVQKPHRKCHVKQTEMSFSESLFHGKPRIKCPLLSPQKMLKKKHRHYLEKILYLWTLFGHGKTFSRKLPTTLGAGTGGTAAPVIHCFGAQRAVEKPRSENEANSHWSVLKTRAFWSCFSLRNSFCVFLWLFFFEIAIGFLASSSSMKAKISFKLSNNIYVTCQSTLPWRKKLE